MNGGNGTMGRTDVPSAAVTLLRLHLLVDKPECVLLGPGEHSGAPATHGSRLTRWPGRYPRLRRDSAGQQDDSAGRQEGYVHGETDVDEQVAAATSDERRRRWREEDGDLAEHSSTTRTLSLEARSLLAHG